MLIWLQYNVYFKARHGTILEWDIKGTTTDGVSLTKDDMDVTILENERLSNITDWTDCLQRANIPEREARDLGKWLTGMLGTNFTRLGHRGAEDVTVTSPGKDGVASASSQ